MKTLLFALLVASTCEAQNLVPNPSFEEKTECPYGDMLSLPYACLGWVASRLSPDYAHRCGSNGYGIPSNTIGSQQPYNPLDSAYAGVDTWATGNPNYREHMRCTLISHLDIGTKYYVSFKASLGDSSMFATNRLGVQFTTVPYLDTSGLDPNPSPINNMAQVQSDAVITDAVNWTTVKGSFIADSAYTQLLLGNFYDYSQTVVVNMNGIYSVAFYYVDEVCVSTDSLECETVTSITFSPKTSPSSAIWFDQAAHRIHARSIGTSTVVMYDVLGRAVSTGSGVGTYDIPIDLLAPGVYLLRLETKRERIVNKQFIIR